MKITNTFDGIFFAVYVYDAYTGEPMFLSDVTTTYEDLTLEDAIHDFLIEEGRNVAVSENSVVARLALHEIDCAFCRDEETIEIMHRQTDKGIQLWGKVKLTLSI